jgi:hypothetical protein
MLFGYCSDMTSNQGQSRRPMERLAAAMLLQATMDIRTGSGATAASAIVWLRQRGDDCLSFNSCCRLLNRDPDAVRVALDCWRRERQSDCVIPEWFEKAAPPVLSCEYDATFR